MASSVTALYYEQSFYCSQLQGLATPGPPLSGLGSKSQLQETWAVGWALPVPADQPMRRGKLAVISPADTPQPSSPTGRASRPLSGSSFPRNCVDW